MRALILAVALAAPLSAQTPFEAGDLYQLAQVEDPQVSPDGTRVLYTLASFDIGTDRKVNDLWIADVTAKGARNARLVVKGTGSGGRWSPDGSRIAYAGNLAGKPQVFVLTVADGRATALTIGKLAPEGLAWSPDGTKLAFVATVEGSPAKVNGLPAKPEGASWAPDPRIITSYQYRTNEAGYLQTGYRHIFVLDVAGGQPKQITKGDLDHVARQGSIEWTRDGRALLAVSNRRPNGERMGRESDLWRVPLEGEPRQLTDVLGSEREPKVSPDGRQIAFIGFPASREFYVQDDLWIVPSDGGAPRNLTAAFDRPVSNPVWAEDGRSVYALFNEAGVTRVGLFPASGGAPRTVIGEVGGTRLYLPSAGGGYDARRGTVAFTSLHTDRPAGLGLTRAGRTLPGIDPNATWRASKRIGKLEEVRYKSSADGREIQGWVQYPADFDPAKRYPLILDIHGGPNTDYGPMFSITHQLYAARGYMVLFTNPRGSIGYGEQFANFFGKPYPSDDHRDLMSGVDLLAQRPYVDARNLFIGGGSGGGLLTLWAIGQEPDKFRGAVALRPVSDWSVQALSSDIQATTTDFWVKGTPWDNPELFRSLSPNSLIGRVKTPTMIITGEADYRTPIAQSEMTYQALRGRGVDAALVRLPEANHGMGRPSQWLQSILLPLDWFEKYRVK